MRRHTCADGSFEWYVLNGHTRRHASKLFRTRAAAAAERARLQVKLELAKERVLKRTPSPKYCTSRPPLSQDGASYDRGRIAVCNQSPVAAFTVFGVELAVTPLDQLRLRLPTTNSTG